MRYRRVSTRYLHLVPIRGPAPWGDVLRSLAPVVSVAPLQWRPPVDVCETPEAFIVVVEVAGLDEEAVSIDLYDDALVIDGERRIETCGPQGVYHAAEIRQGRFHAEVVLPGGHDPEAVVATYEQGLLRVVLPRSGVGEG
jgi:HSP20 family protein